MFSVFRNRRGPGPPRLTRASSSKTILPTQSPGHGRDAKHNHFQARFKEILDLTNPLNRRPRFRLSEVSASHNSETVQSHGRMTAVRPLLVVVFTGFGFLWLWWSLSSTGTTVTAVPPRIVRTTAAVDEFFTRHDEDFERLPSPTKATRPVQDTFTSTSSPPAPSTSSSRYINFSELLFPEHGIDGTARPWIGANHKTLRTLFECIELGDCGPNQEKGASLAASRRAATD